MRERDRPALRLVVGGRDSEAMPAANPGFGMGDGRFAPLHVRLQRLEDTKRRLAQLLENWDDGSP